MKMHWRIFVALSLVALTSAAPSDFPSMGLEDPGDESENDVLKFHSSLELDRQWLSFKSTYDKSYGHDEEELLRKKIFAANLKTIEEHNQLHAKGLKTFTLGVNKFADLEEQEFVKQMSCLSNKKSPKTFKDSVRKLPKDVSDLPDSVDWRTSGAVTRVKDQGTCGSCWAFSAAGALESHNFLKTGRLVSLSVQNILDCADENYGASGCNGGFPEAAFEYVSSNKGIDLGKTYPYEEKVGDCRYDAVHIGGNCTSWVAIEPGSEEDLQTAVANYGPISVCIDAGYDSFQLYEGGIYADEQCESDELSLNLAVLVVGYGSTDTKPKIDYWIVKNSWGAEWGNKGYVLMARNRKNHCGIASDASFPVV